MSSPRTLVGRQFCCHPQSLEGYLCTHPVLPLREDESHRSVNEVPHLVLLIMHWRSSLRITDVQDALKGSNAVCLSPERSNVGNSTVCEMDLFLLPILPYFQCFETSTDTIAFYRWPICVMLMHGLHSFVAFLFKTARTIIIYYAWAALPGVKNHHVHRVQQSRSGVACTWAVFVFVRQLLCCSAQVKDKQPVGIFGTKWAFPKAKTALNNHHPWVGNPWRWDFLCFPCAAMRGSFQQPAELSLLLWRLLLGRAGESSRLTSKWDE